MIEPTRRTILIVEDDQLLSESFKAACRLALYELAAAALPFEVRIAQAYTQEEALRAVEGSADLVFASVDLALDQSEKGLQPEARARGQEASGMRVLQRLAEQRPATLSVVISGEMLLSYATDALQRYGVLHFFEKSRFGVEHYQAVVKAALWYEHARGILDYLERDDPQHGGLDAAEQAWAEAVAAAAAAGVARQRFPVDLDLRIRAVRARGVDEVTGLPMGRLVHAYLKQLVLQQGASVLRVRVRNFAAFQQAYPSQVDPLHYFLAETLRAATAPYPQAFLGLLAAGVGGAPGLVLALDGESAARFASVKRQVEEAVARNAHLFASSLDKARPVTIPEVEVTCWQRQDHPFTDLHELLDALG